MGDTESKTTQDIVVIGWGHWGKGPDLKTAKVNYKKFGGPALTEGYTILEFQPGTEFTGVDGMGSVHWKWAEGFDHPEGQTPPPPNDREVAPR